jgi:hypothetical protein
VIPGAVVEAFLDEVGGGPAGLVLSGDAGIGKTILWQEGSTRLAGALRMC